MKNLKLNPIILLFFSITLALVSSGCKVDGKISGWVIEAPSKGVSLSSDTLNVPVLEGSSATVVFMTAEPVKEDLAYSWEIAGGTGRFVTASGSGSLRTGDQALILTLQVLQDTLHQGNLDYTLTLSGEKISKPVSVTLVVEDDEGLPTVQFASASQSVNESAGTVTVQVNQSVVSTVATTIPFTLSGTALGSGTDYSIASSSITIPAGQTSATTTLTIVNDAVAETNETIVLTMGTPINATVSGTSAHTITIIDDDLTLSIANITVSESATNAVVTVSANANANSDVTFSWATSNGTATAGSDYTASSGTATLTTGTSSKTLSIPILNDSTACELDETFTVTISGASGAAITTATATVTIQDDETPHISMQPVAVVPGITAGFTAQLDRTCPQDLTFSYATQNGTASAGTDYTSASGTLTITAGATTAPINITTASQTLATSKTFTVQLSSPSTPAVLSSTSATGTIAAPTLDLDLSSSLPASVNFTRASIATYTGADQAIHQVAADVPRFDHDPSTGTALGLLIEESRTNSVGLSENFGSTSWIKNGGATVTGGVASPDGGTNAYDAADSATTGSTYLNYWLGPLPAGQYTVSIFVKKTVGASTWPTFRVKESVTSTYRGIDFNTNDASNGSHGTTQARGYVDYGAWYRVWFTATYVNTLNALEIFPALNKSGGGNGTGTITIFGVQVERGGYMTSYIPTSGSAVTRAADIAKINTSGSWFNSQGGSIHANFHLVNFNSSGTPFIVNFPDTVSGAGTDYFGLRMSNSSGWKYRATSYVGGSTQADIADSATAAANDTVKLAAGFSANDFAFYKAGAQKGTASSGTVPSGAVELILGANSSASGTVDASLHFTKVRYWKERLNNASLALVCQ